MRTALPLAASLITIGACGSSPEHRPADVPLPEQWSETHVAVEPPETWWKGFADPELDSLIERAVVANHDLEIARARVREARALRDFVAGAQLPQVDANASFTRSQASSNTPQGAVTGSQPRNLYDVGFDAIWEIDLFGSNRSALSAAEAGVEAAEEGRRDALVTLLGEVARTYVELRGSQRQIELTRANADAQKRTLDLTRSRFQAGLATELDVARAQTLYSNTQARVPSLDGEVSSAVHRLSVLIGQPPTNLAPELTAPEPIPTAQGPVAELASGVPSDLLRRRPDIRRAEREFAQAAALTDQATADLYPKLTLGASIGLQAPDSGDLFENASRTWSVGPSLLAPIFHGDRLRAIVRAQTAQQEQALERYRQVILLAFAEVEDALSGVAREHERHELLVEAVQASRRALDLANDLQLRGLIDFLEVLDAQRSQLVAEALLAESETILTSQTVALYKALGGGWESLDHAGEPSEQPGAPPASEDPGAPAGPAR